MAIKGNKKKEMDVACSYDVTVTRAKDLSKDGKTAIACDLEVNGVKIYGCFYRVYEDRKNPGEEKGFIAFPSRKGSDDKWYQHAWFPISDELLADIEKQINEQL